MSEVSWSLTSTGTVSPFTMRVAFKRFLCANNSLRDLPNSNVRSDGSGEWAEDVLVREEANPEAGHGRLVVSTYAWRWRSMSSSTRAGCAA